MYDLVTLSIISSNSFYLNSIKLCNITIKFLSKKSEFSFDIVKNDWIIYNWIKTSFRPPIILKLEIQAIQAFQLEIQDLPAPVFLLLTLNRKIFATQR